MSIEDAADRVWPLRREYASVLRLAGYEKIIEEKLHIAVNHTLRKLKRIQLYRSILDIITRRKTRNVSKGKSQSFCQGSSSTAQKFANQTKKSI